MANVFVRLRESNIKLKPEKCRFGDNEVDYLGFNISDKGTRPSRKKVEALVKLPPPLDTRIITETIYLDSVILQLIFLKCWQGNPVDVNGMTYWWLILRSVIR